MFKFTVNIISSHEKCIVEKWPYFKRYIRTKARIDLCPVKRQLIINGKANIIGSEGIVNSANVSLGTPASINFRRASQLDGARPICNR